MTFNVQPYPTAILDLQKVDGFARAFDAMKPRFKMHYEAYEALEEIYEMYFGRRRYSDYAAFCYARRNHQKKTKNL